MKMTVLSGVAFCTVALAALPTLRSIPASRRLKPGVQAPEVTLRTLDGKSRAIHVLRGERRDRVLALVFYSSASPWCGSLLGELSALAQEFKGQNVIIAVVDECLGTVDRTLVDLEKQARDGGLALEVMRDSQREVADTFGALTTPDVFLIGSDCKIQYTGRVNDLVHPSKPESVKRAYLRDAIVASLAGKTPSPDRTAPGGMGIPAKANN